MLATLREAPRPATAEEQAVLARWAGWGALPRVFDEADEEFSEERARLRALLGDDEDAWAQARRSTINAHYTSAEVVEAMWGAVARLGFETGLVLEPGCGSGNFIGFAPDGAKVVGVEMDRTTAAVAAYLYGARATIHARRFEEFSVPDDHFDLVIGNVPFGDVVPHDPRHNRKRRRLHNYFIVKSLHLSRPGGLVAVLTSRYTLDAQRTGAREAIAALADLVGAVRLPAGAFSASSGTEVVSDLLILRRRPPDDEPVATAAWMRAPPLALGDDGEAVPVNELFAAHPELVAGRLALARGMYRDGEVTVRAEGSLAEALAGCLDTVIERAGDSGLLYVPRPAPARVEARAEPEPPITVVSEVAQEGSFVSTATGGIARIVGGEPVAYRPRVVRDVRELRGLIDLRDAARAVLDIQVRGGSDDELGAAQDVLAARYDGYRRWYGPLNRFELMGTGRLDPETGEEVLRRVRPRMGGFRTDPDWPLVAALEVFDDETQRARPAAIFTERIIEPPTERTSVETPAEAVAVCLDESGRVTLERIAGLLGLDEEAARRALAGLAWEDPESGEWVPAARYLSGNVRKKLAAAAAVAERDPRFAPHVEALEAVLPAQLEPGEIAARLGAPWIPAEDIEAFCADVLEADATVEHLATIGSWRVGLRTGSRSTVTLTSEWGTGRADGLMLLDASLNQRLVVITDEIDGGRRVRNDEETLAAREKQEALGERFAAWVWEDEERAARLAARYNELFCSVVVPTYDGSHLSLPGLATTFIPHRHQRDAVARVLVEGRALLAHAVGAGKTATMVMAAMELRRLGLAAKPAVVVPNHMLDQFAREWLQLYPKARVLLADRDRLTGDQRREFVARCATGDWDGVVFTHSGFTRVPVGDDLLAEYLREQIGRFRAALIESKGGEGLSVKRLEKRLARMEEMYQRLVAAEAKDDGIRFEETGIDYLFLDEAHLHKNLRVDSSIDGMAKEGSQRAQDLHVKLWARRRAGGERVVTLATATPIANSLAEMWVMQTYLQPDVLDEVDMGPFDAWAASFGRTVTAVELAPDGASYRLQTRFARFQNVPELQTMYRQVADVYTADDLDLPVPALEGGKPEIVVVPASEELRDYVSELAERAKAIRIGSVDPSEDNMLKVTGDGRRAALDVRLVGLPPDPEGGKVTAAANDIAAIYRHTADLRFLDPFGEPSERPGALQLVFCDTSTPTGDRWNAYDELRRALVERGVPRGAVRFIHEAGSDEAKAKLFQACRDGRVAVLVGSTEKMGVGTNIQARAVALHHLDCPWRPADIEQREGRILRQGNQNERVRILRYVTEESFDIYMWQTVERKATFIAQITSGKVAEREVDDIGDQALSYAEVKALATGNPLIVEKAGIDAEVAKLGRLQVAHDEDQYRLRRVLSRAERSRASAEERIERLSAALAARVDTHGDRFAMTVDGTRFRKRPGAGRAFATFATALLAATPEGERSEPVRFGELGGLSLVAIATKTARAVDLDDDRLHGELWVNIEEADTQLRFSEDEFAQSEPVVLVQRLERRIQSLDEALERARAALDEAERDAERAQARIGQPFEHEARLRTLLQRQREIEEALIPADERPRAGYTEPRVGAAPTDTDVASDSRVAAVSARLDQLPSGVGEAPGHSL